MGRGEAGSRSEKNVELNKKVEGIPWYSFRLFVSFWFILALFSFVLLAFHLLVLISIFVAFGFSFIFVSCF